MDPRTSGRIKKYGVCLNDKCTKYKEIQEILHGNYECPECKKKLSPCAPPKGESNKKPIIIGGAVIAVLAIIAVLFFAFSGGSSSDDEIVEDTTKVEQTTPVNTVEKHDTVVVRDTVVQNNTTTTTEKTSIKTVETHVKKGDAQPSASASSSKSTLNMGYGKYTGAVKNGKPNGMGTMRYSSSHQIESRDSKGRTADPGDYVTGEWNDGHLVQGRWYDSSNNVKGSLMIGM